MYFVRPISLIAIFILSLPQAYACEYTVSDEVKTVDGNYNYQVTFRSIDGEIPSSEKLDLFRDYIRKHADVDPLKLLLRQREIYVRVYPTAAKKFDQIIEAQVGRIRPINCIEQALLVIHIGYFSADTEYGAFVFTKGSSVRALVKSSSWPGVNFDDILPQVQQFIESGWVLTTQIHNHPFIIGNETGDIGGTLIPSDPDTQFFLKLKNDYQLENASITNGFDSIEFRADEFQKILEL